MNKPIHKWILTIESECKNMQEFDHDYVDTIGDSITIQMQEIIGITKVEACNEE